MCVWILGRQSDILFICVDGILGASHRNEDHAECVVKIFGIWIFLNCIPQQLGCLINSFLSAQYTAELAKSLGFVRVLVGDLSQNAYCGVIVRASDGGPRL